MIQSCFSDLVYCYISVKYSLWALPLTHSVAGYGDKRGNLTASKLDYLTFRKVKLNRRKRNDTQAPQPGFILLTWTQTLVWRLVEHYILHILALFRIYRRSCTSSEGTVTHDSSTAAHSCLNEPPSPSISGKGLTAGGAALSPIYYFNHFRNNLKSNHLRSNRPHNEQSKPSPQCLFSFSIWPGASFWCNT